MATERDAEAGRDAPLRWGESREMKAFEALMWRAETDPRLRSTICGLELLDRVPDWTRFEKACEWATRMVPRFRQKVVEPAFGFGNPRWVNDPDFDLHYHVRRIRLPEPGGWQELLSAAEQVAMTPFDKARSPWESVLFEGLPEGRAAHLLKMHHSTTDGMGGFQLFSQLHSPMREPNPQKPQPPVPLPEWATPSELLREQIRSDARALPGLLPNVGDLMRVLSRPVETVGSALRFGASLTRVLADPDAQGSPLLRARSLSWRFLALDVAFKDLRAAAKAAGASLNDAFLAALLGAFRRYHEELDHPIDKMPIAIPINVRREGDPEGGNRFAGARFAAPVGIVDPRERMEVMGSLVRAARGEPAIDAMALFAPALARLPGPLISRLAGGLTKANDLQASNVPGFRTDVFLAGAKIERFYGFGPLPGCAAMVTLVTHGETCCVAANVDPAAITEPDRFSRCLEEGFAEVLTLAPGAAPPQRRL
jgi:diacylglycerol O-acyltransferase / wax synthase